MHTVRKVALVGVWAEHAPGLQPVVAQAHLVLAVVWAVVGAQLGHAVRKVALASMGAMATARGQPVAASQTCTE